MIRAIQIDHADYFIRRRLRFAFELTTSDGRTLFYGRAPEGEGQGLIPSEGWYTREELETEAKPNPQAPARLVMVDLPRDCATALADAILTDTTGTPAGDVRALRADLTHERQRRDALEDQLIGWMGAVMLPDTKPGGPTLRRGGRS